MRTPSLVFATASAAILFAARPALAEGSVETSAGAKAFVGGGLFTTPTNIPAGYEALGFAGNGGGIGYGGGAYFEARFIKYLGLEIGLGYDQSDVHRKVTMTTNYGTFEVTEKFVSKSLRIPVLAKAIAPVPFGRLSFGIGPEFVSAMTPDSSDDITSGPAGSPKSANLIHAEKAGNTRLAFDFGATIELPGSLELPVGLRMSKSMGQPDAWQDRVKLETTGGALTSYTVQAETSWDFRLVLGLGYKF